MQTDQEIIGEIGEKNFAQAISKEMHHPHKQHSVNTTRETLLEQSSPLKSEEGKVEENIVAHNVVDNCEVGRRNQAQQATCMPCTAVMPSKSHGVIRTRLG